MRARKAGLIGLLAVLGIPGYALAHGGVAMDQDVCKLTIGPYVMHFTGYQPDASRSEFCEDIPNIGRTIIVLDFLDNAVRDIPLEFAIVKQASGAVDEGAVIYRIPAQRYPTGSMAIEYAFSEPGNYAGIVVLKDQANHRSIFPFEVGGKRIVLWLAAGGVATIAGAVALFLWAKRRLAVQTGISRQDRRA